MGWLDLNTFIVKPNRTNMATLEEEIVGLSESLRSVIGAVADAGKEISVALRTAPVHTAGNTNAFGDHQLEVDILSDKICFDRLRACGAVHLASSEEQSDLIPLGGKGFCVAFDPLDGSSIISTDFAVGSIFGIWKGETFMGQTGRDQVAAAYVVYGPRTVLVLGRPTSDGKSEIVQEFTLHGEEWRLERDRMVVGERKVFAPGNLRASLENHGYSKLVEEFIAKQYTLRYTGGMVPDVHHILSKGGGVFMYASSQSYPAKLRLLYECAPLARIVEIAGGASSDGKHSLLDIEITSSETRCPVFLGSTSEVARCGKALST